jgi:hypothetical protein
MNETTKGYNNLSSSFDSWSTSDKGRYPFRNWRFRRRSRSSHNNLGESPPTIRTELHSGVSTMNICENDNSLSPILGKRAYCYIILLKFYAPMAGNSIRGLKIYFKKLRVKARLREYVYYLTERFQMEERNLHT